MTSLNHEITLPHSDLYDEELSEEISQPHSLLKETDEIQKLRDLTFNPFSSLNRGRENLTLTPDIDPDSNYFRKMIQMIDDCDYHNEDSFQNKIRSCDGATFLILHQNVRSIVNKHDDFVNFLARLRYEFSVIGVTETWLTKHNMDECSIPRYKFVGQSRNNKHGGGVGMYVNKSHQFTVRTDLSINLENSIEAQFIELNHNPNNILIGVIYRPPNEHYKLFEDNLSDVLQLINRENKKCFLMGDFNIDLLKYNINDNTNNFIN